MEGGAERVNARVTTGEDGATGGRSAGAVAEQEGDAARNAGPAVDEHQRARRSGGEVVGDERKVGAGENDGVDRIAVRLVEQTGEFAGIIGGVGAHAAQLRLGELDEARRAVADDGAVGSEFGGQPVDVRLADGRRGTEDADDACPAERGGGLERRHRPDHGQVERSADRGERDRRRRIARDDDERRAVALDQPSEQRGHARGDLGLGPGAIGKAGIVGGIDDADARQPRADGSEDRQAADPGVEQEDGRGHRMLICRPFEDGNSIGSSLFTRRSLGATVVRVDTDHAARCPPTVARPPRGDSPAMTYHLVMRCVWLLVLLVPALVLHLGWWLARRSSPWPNWFLGAATRASGVRLTVRGTPLGDDVVIIANHVSWLDILVIGGVVRCRFVAQDQIYHWPLIGWLARLNATVFVSRTDRAGVVDQIARVRAAIAGVMPVAIFPEGTTTDGRSLLPFKPPLLAALADPPRRLLVQPVVLDFDAAGSALAWIGTETGTANALRVLGRGGIFAVTAHFLDAFDPTGLDRKAIAREARRRITAVLPTNDAPGAPPLDSGSDAR